MFYHIVLYINLNVILYIISYQCITILDYYRIALLYCVFRDTAHDHLLNDRDCFGAPVSHDA